MSVILVTGAAGFIGHHLVPGLIGQGHSVVALDIADLSDFPDAVKKVRCDIRDAEAMTKLADDLRPMKVQYAIHLAAIAAPAIAQKDPNLAWGTNVLGTYNVLRLLDRAGIRRVVFFSSAHVYGISPKYLPTDESHPLSLQDMYTSTKVAGEQLCQLYYANHGVSYTAVRLFNGYGPGQSPDYFIGVKLRQAKAGGPVTLRNREVTKDWIHVNDIVEAAITTLFTEYVGPLNIGTSVETNLGRIADTIAEAFKVEVIPEESFDPGPTRMRCDLRRTRATLKWEPKISFEDGLHSLIHSYKNE